MTNPSVFRNPSVFLRVPSVFVCVALLGLPAAAIAQTPQPPAAPDRKLQVEPVHDGFVVAPDARFTRINDRYGTLAGVYGGWLMDRTLLVGGGGYWLANNARDFKMAYGGAVVEWFIRGDREVGLSARALIGGGRATLSNTAVELFGTRAPAFEDVMRFGRGGGMHGFDMRPFDRDMNVDLSTLPGSRFVYTEDFFIAEPQINGVIRVTDWLRFNAGVGYRLIGGTSNPNVDERLRGLSGSVAIVFGGGGS